MSVLIRAEAVRFSHSENEVLKEISFTVSAGEFVVVVGQNGAGKSTLFNVLMGFMPTDAGELEVLGGSPHEDSYELRHRIGYLSDKIDFPRAWTVRDALDFNRKFFSNYRSETEQELLETFQIDVDRPFASFSTGEGRKAVIAVGLSHDPELIIVDEISAYLDVMARDALLDYLKRKCVEDQRAVLLATNIPDGLMELSDRLLVIDDGRSVYGTAKNVLKAKEGSFFRSLSKRMGQE